MTQSVRVARSEELETCFAIRREVFVEGQNVTEAEEIDGLDPLCTHFLALRDGVPVGTARLREVDGSAKAERVAVLEKSRGCGTGRELMLALEACASSRGFRELVLNAQVPVIPFYERLGYTPEGEVFLEADIPHLKMRKRIGD